MKKIFLIAIFLYSGLFAKEYTLNLVGSNQNENQTIKVDFNADDEG